MLTTLSSKMHIQSNVGKRDESEGGGGREEGERERKERDGSYAPWRGSGRRETDRTFGGR